MLIDMYRKRKPKTKVVNPRHTALSILAPAHCSEKHTSGANKSSSKSFFPHSIQMDSKTGVHKHYISEELKRNDKWHVRTKRLARDNLLWGQ
jgi:hypothetical protein